MNKLTTLLIAIVAYTLTACAGHEHSDNHTDTDKHESHDGEIVISPEQAKTSGITTEAIKAAPFSSAMLVGGQIMPSQGLEQTIAATADGIVRFANTQIAEGTAVGSGQAIATISARNLQNGDPQAKAKAEYEAAKAEYERAKPLAADQIISQKEFSQIRMAYETARIAYEAQAKNASPSGITIASPMGGYVKSLLVKQGEYVSMGQPIAIVTNNRRLQLRADVPVSDMQQISALGSANFRIAGSNRVYSISNMHGKLLSYGRSTQDGSAFVPVTFEFDNIGDIVSGAYAEVWLLSKQQTSTLSVPIDALTEAQGHTYIYIKVAKDVYTKREVTTGGTDGKRIEIKSGLKAGEQVVVSGAYAVRLASASTAIPAHNHNH